MGKWISIRNKRKNALLQTAFDLFRDKGFAKRLSLISFQMPALQRELLFIF